MQRCIVAPKKHDQLLEVAAELVRALSRRPPAQRGNDNVFLPGMSHLLDFEKLLNTPPAGVGIVNCELKLLHSEIIGN